MIKSSTKLILAGLLFLLLISSVSAVGIAIPPMENDELQLQDNDETSFTFILKNDDAVQRVVKFKAEVPVNSGVLLNDKSKFENQYVLAPHTSQNIVVKIKTKDKMKLPLTYGYSIQSAGSGQIMFDTWVLSDFLLNVDSCSSSCYSWRLGIPLSYLNFEISVEGEVLSQISELQIYNEKGRIVFDRELDLTNFLENAIKIEYNRIEINSVLFSILNVPATVTMYDLPYDSKGEVKILRDGIECSSCDIVSYDANKGKLVFTVEGFSTYTTIKDTAYVDGTITSSSSASTDDILGIEFIDEPELTNEVDEVVNPVEVNDQDTSVLEAFQNKLNTKDSVPATSGLTVGAARNSKPLVIMFVSIIVVAGLIIGIKKNYTDDEVKDYLKVKK